MGRNTLNVFVSLPVANWGTMFGTESGALGRLTRGLRQGGALRSSIGRVAQPRSGMTGIARAATRKSKLSSFSPAGNSGRQTSLTEPSEWFHFRSCSLPNIGPGGFFALKVGVWAVSLQSHLLNISPLTLGLVPVVTNYG